MGQRQESMSPDGGMNENENMDTSMDGEDWYSEKRGQYSWWVFQDNLKGIWDTEKNPFNPNGEMWRYH
jgi:hypothetical protein